MLAMCRRNLDPRPLQSMAELDRPGSRGHRTINKMASGYCTSCHNTKHPWNSLELPSWCTVILKGNNKATPMDSSQWMAQTGVEMLFSLYY